ncbi:hypothetical protein AWENTII_003964 [Aspergillus wentii]
MSDALCGPSNALQNFQKHTSVDRTLQQDRLTSRQSPSQGFRSQNPSEGILDPEFAAFESNLAGPYPFPEIQHAGPLVAHTPPQFSVPSTAESANWAADFERLQISRSSHPIAQQHAPSAASASALAQQGWQDEFLRQHQTPVQHQQSYGGGFQPSFAPSFPLHGAPMSTFQPPQETATNQQPATETFDESAFEAAFEQARADMETQAIEATQADANISHESAQQGVTLEPQVHEEIRIGSDTIPYADKEDAQARSNDGDELAKTAGQLLDSVSHDQSQKFKQSSFLALMRRIRDREVHVEGDEFRETFQSLHPGGKYYPEGQKQQQQPALSHSTPDLNTRIASNETSKFGDIQNSDLTQHHINS